VLPGASFGKALWCARQQVARRLEAGVATQVHVKSSSEKYHDLE
jgi:hypothetical protein